MSARLTAEKAACRVFEMSGGKVALDQSTYVNTRTKARFIDSHFGEWWATPNNVFQGREHPAKKQEKIRKTCLNRYGVSNIFALPKNRKKCIKSIKLPIEEIKKRIKQKHGNNVFIIPESYKNTGASAVFCDIVYGKWTTKVTNVIIQGKGHPKRVGKKRKQTCLTKYGVDNPSKSAAVKEKIKKSNLKKYGASCPLANKEIRKKIKQTNLKKYGCENPCQNKEIALKSAKSSNNSYILYHWKTNEELVCVGSWERKVIEYLNQSQIDFKWQPKIFIMSNGKTYRPDLYLIQDDKWVEIKGYFRKDAQEKWDWFHKEYPNSELWDKNKLKEMNIL